MILCLIAICIYYVGKLVKKVSWKKLILSFGLIMIGYFATNKLVMMWIQENIGINLNGSQSGFSLYVGPTMNRMECGI